MSQTHITVVDSSSDDEEEKNDEEDNNGVIDKSKNQKKGSLQFGGCSYKRAKKVVVSPFRKLYKRHKKNPSSSSCSPNSHQITDLANSSSSTSRKSGSYFNTRCLCVSKPQTLDTDFEGVDSNDDPCVSFESIKSLIENNDFYSKECNTHIL